MAETMFADNGYAGTSVRMIARALQISDPAIHYHFPTKQSLYDALLAQPEYGELPIEGGAVTREKVIEQLLHLFAWWTSRPELGRMLLREQLANHEPSVGFLLEQDSAWATAIREPLARLYGRRANEIAERLYLLMAGTFWDAILSYGDNVRAVLQQSQFRERVAAMVELTLPRAGEEAG